MLLAEVMVLLCFAVPVSHVYPKTPIKLFISENIGPIWIKIYVWVALVNTPIQFLNFDNFIFSSAAIVAFMPLVHGHS